MKPTDDKLVTYIDYAVEHNGKDLNLMLVIMLEYQNTKIFLQKDTHQVCLGESSLSRK